MKVLMKSLQASFSSILVFISLYLEVAASRWLLCAFGTTTTTSTSITTTASSCVSAFLVRQQAQPRPSSFFLLSKPKSRTIIVKLLPVVLRTPDTLNLLHWFQPFSRIDSSDSSENFVDDCAVSRIDKKTLATTTSSISGGGGPMTIMSEIETCGINSSSTANNVAIATTGVINHHEVQNVPQQGEIKQAQEKQQQQQQEVILKDDILVVRPMYITIGPPCSGKTTWIRQQQQRQQQNKKARHNTIHDATDPMITTTTTTTTTTTGSAANSTNNDDMIIVDVALDDQNGVYEKIPVEYFLKQQQHRQQVRKGRGGERQDFIQQQQQQRKIYGKSVLDRIHASDQDEIRTVLHVLTKQMNLSTFQNRIESIYQNHIDHTMICTTLYKVITQILSKHEQQQQQHHHYQRHVSNQQRIQQVLLPPHVDLFIRESFYIPYSSSSGRNNSNGTAVDRAYEQLQTITLTQAVSWGNTNTRPNEYKRALEIAAQQRRPVYFVVLNGYRTLRGSGGSSSGGGGGGAAAAAPSAHDGVGMNQKQNSSSLASALLFSDDLFDDNVFELDCLNYEELLQRNIKRFLQTGRYIPSSVIWDMLKRTKDSIERVMHAWNHEVQYTNPILPTSLETEQRNKELLATDSRNSLIANRKRISKWEFDRLLAEMINFDMNKDRIVMPKGMDKGNQTRNNPASKAISHDK